MVAIVRDLGEQVKWEKTRKTLQRFWRTTLLIEQLTRYSFPSALKYYDLFYLQVRAPVVSAFEL